MEPRGEVGEPCPGPVGLCGGAVLAWVPLMLRLILLGLGLGLVLVLGLVLLLLSGRLLMGGMLLVGGRLLVVVITLRSRRARCRGVLLVREMLWRRPWWRCVVLLMGLTLPLIISHG